MKEEVRKSCTHVLQRKGIMERWRAYRQKPVYYHSSDQAGRPKKRRIRFSRRFLRRGGFVLLGLFVLWLLFWSPAFAVSEIVLAGETTDSLMSASQNLVGRNLLTLSEQQVFREFLESESSLASLRLTRGFPHQLQVYFSRRQPSILWLVGETRWSIDESGVLFPYDPVTAEGRPTVVDQRSQPVRHGQQLVSPQFVAFVREGGAEIPSLIGGRLMRGEVDETTLQLRFVTEWGWSIIFDTSRPLSGQLASLALILKDRRELIHEYVDLRLPGRAYLK
jgi:hypothetical protein